MKDIWKWIATATLSMLVTLAAAYYTREAQAVSVTEVRRILATESPYIPDQALVRETLSQVKQLRDDIGQLNREVGELRGLLAGDRRISHRD